jgi:hypothetical protein
MKKIFILIIFHLIFLYSTDIIKANQVIYSESFDNPDILNSWNNLLNIGDNRWGVCLDTASPAHWQITNGWMGIILDGTSCTTIISPTDLNLSEINNYRFSFEWRFDESIDMDRNIVFLWQDERNWYGLKQYGTGLHLEKVVEGVVRSLPNSQVTYPFQANQTYHFSITYLDQAKVIITINDQIIIESDDTPPFIENNKTIALKTALGGGRSVSFFDNLVVESLGVVQGLENTLQTSLDVPLFKQDDPRWADKEYDSATNWSENNFTIKRWGCALASMTMILNYYGINQLPSGELITPDSLNNWLNHQADGYIGEGLLNWLAVTRLTRQISELIGTPKLEYSVIVSDLLSPSIEQINLFRPTILSIMGHFLVSHGYLIDLSDLIILDPSYPYQYFSEHQTELISTRIFTPSQTDLSYILITTDPEIAVEISDENDQVIKTTQMIESLSSHNENQSEQEVTQYKITQLAKPASQLYKIHFSRTDNSPISFNLLSYDSEGNVKQNLVNNSTDLNEATYLLDYKKEIDNQSNSSNNIDIKTNDLIKIVTWESLTKIIEQLKIDNLVEEYVYHYLIKIISWAKIETTDNQSRYISLLYNYLSKIKIDEGIKNSLLSDLNYLKDSI